ncbi:MAG: ATP-binding protein [Candidatus Cloacimonetes bacterium]|nr:ATP-binding protein [Candidatus Cloacimonadota bacterium]
MYIKRDISAVLREAMKMFPAVILTGPRQSGKTTLAKHVFPDYDYVNLEDPDLRLFATQDPRGFISRYPRQAIFDEFQRVPELTSYLQSHIDQVNETGMYVLTGSNQFVAMEQVTQSLAGRVAIMKLLPFSCHEIGLSRSSGIEEILFQGGYPRIFSQDIDPTLFYRSYLETYLQKDVRNLKSIQDLSRFHTFVRLCAGRTAQILNYTGLSNDAGVEVKTLKGWLSVLEGSFIISIVPPFHGNINKRLIKSPKLFFIDSGLAAHLLGMISANQIETHPLMGALFETFVFSELMKFRMNRKDASSLFYYRESNGVEIDFIIETGDGILPIEVKASATPVKGLFKNLIAFSKICTRCKTPLLLYGGDTSSHMYGCDLLPYNRLHEYLVANMGPSCD